MSAVVLRELVAKLGLQVDEAAYQKADKGLKIVKDDLVSLDNKARDASGRFIKGARAMGAEGQQLGRTLEKAAKPSDGGGFGAGLTQYLGGAAVAAALGHMVELASSANETQNVLSEVFGQQGADTVNEWAEGTSQALGRSYYQLVANTGALGAMLQPMVGNADKAREMSQQFATLAVDLGSFFNASDEDALAALKSGISGESEPLKRFGIVMQDATLAEYAHANGIKKKLSAMTVAEKTELRYRFILANTTKAQGDAARTADGFANSSKALADHVKDLSTEIGQVLLPIAGRLVKWADVAIGMFGQVAKSSHIVEGALVTLGYIMLATFGPAILAAAGTAAAFAAVALIVDDLITLFTGGESAIGRFMDTLFGEGTADAFVASMGEAMGWLKEQWAALLVELGKVDWNHIIELTASNLRALGTVLTDVFTAVWPYVEKTAKTILEIVAAVGRFLAATPLFKVLGWLGGKAASGIAGAFSDNLSDAQKEARDENKSAHTLRREARLAQEAADRAAGVSTSAAPGVSAAPGSVTVPGPRAALGGAAGTTIHMGGVNIVVPAGTTPDAAAKAAAKTASIERRRLKYAFGSSTGGKASG